MRMTGGRLDVRRQLAPWRQRRGSGEQCGASFRRGRSTEDTWGEQEAGKIREHEKKTSESGIDGDLEFLLEVREYAVDADLD